jgi:uncharacterized phiE125 gp8 family phage protein
VTHSSHDDLITDLIWGGVKAFEKRANVCLSAQTWKAFLDKAYDVIELWKYPITGISSIRYYDDDNAMQTLSTDDYFSNVDQGSTGYDPRPCVIEIEDTPSTYSRDDAVVITFTAGYSTIDYDVKQAILAYVYRMYENPNDPVTQKQSFFDLVIADNRSYGL